MIQSSSSSKSSHFIFIWQARAGPAQARNAEFEQQELTQSMGTAVVTAVVPASNLQ